MTAIAGDLVLLEQPVDPFGRAVDDLRFSLQQRGEIEFDAGDFDAVLGQLAPRGLIPFA